MNLAVAGGFSDYSYKYPFDTVGKKKNGAMPASCGAGPRDEGGT